MKEFRRLTVAFDTQTHPKDVPAFRGAIAKKVGWEHDWYHNHDNSNPEGKYIYRYPLVQYKTKKHWKEGEAIHQPMLVFIDRIEEAQHFFVQANWDLKIREQEHKISISEMKAHQVKVGVYDDTFYYQLKRWMPFNEENYARYQELQDDELARLQFLEKLLANHIIGFVKGVKCRLQKPFQVRIDTIQSTHSLRFEDTKMITFNLKFLSNIKLPAHVGIGKAVSRGYGVILPLRKEKDSWAKAASI